MRSLLQPQRSQDSLLQRGTVLKPLLLACALSQLLPFSAVFKLPELKILRAFEVLKSDGLF